MHQAQVAGRRIQALAETIQAPPSRRRQALGQGQDPLAQVFPRGAHQLRGGGRGGGTLVRGQVRQAEVHLMPDPGDHRYGAGADGTHQGLIIKGP